jgi:hypothetical protein
MNQPARPDPARAPRARGWPAPAPPAHPQYRSPARRRITTARPAPEQPMTAASPAAAGPMTARSAATAARPQISARLPTVWLADPVAAPARRPDRPGGHRPGR